MGTEVASACIAAGLKTTVVSRHDTLVPHLGTDLSNLVTRAAIKSGVVLKPAPQQVRLIGTDRVTGLAAADGSALEADIVVTAVGCRPNIEWLGGSGLQLIDGVVVDQYCRATAGVVAAGDVVRVRGSRTLAARTPFWTAALEQARTAGQSLVCGTSATPYVPAPFFWTEAFGLAITISGPIPAAGEGETLAGDLRSGSGLFRWRSEQGITVAAVNHRIAVRKLRTLSRESD